LPGRPDPGQPDLGAQAAVVWRQPETAGRGRKHPAVAGDF